MTIKFQLIFCISILVGCKSLTPTNETVDSSLRVVHRATAAPLEPLSKDPIKLKTTQNPQNLQLRNRLYKILYPNLKQHSLAPKPTTQSHVGFWSTNEEPISDGNQFRRLKNDKAIPGAPAVTTSPQPGYDCDDDRHTTEYYCIDEAESKSTSEGESGWCMENTRNKYCIWRQKCSDKRAEMATGSGITIDLRCLDCGEKDKKDSRCASAHCDSIQEYEKVQRNDRRHKTMCRSWLPDCKDPKFQNFDFCLNCSLMEHPKCKTVECYREGRHRGRHICKNWRPDCSNPLHEKEDLCLDCVERDQDEERCLERNCTKDAPDREYDICKNWVPNCSIPLHELEESCWDCEDKQKDEPACLRRNCTRNATDRLNPICKRFRPNCTLSEHRYEDLCLQCKGKDKKHWRCKEKKWDCNKVDATEDICYYSTTTSSTPPPRMDADDPENMEISAFYDPNPHIGVHARRPDYFTDVTVPTFMGISLIVGILFIVMHLPKCCFGICREPDWDIYGQARPDSSESQIGAAGEYTCIHGQMKAK